jgi:hypothetical protein
MPRNPLRRMLRLNNLFSRIERKLFMRFCIDRAEWQWDIRADYEVFHEK